MPACASDCADIDVPEAVVAELELVLLLLVFVVKAGLTYRLLPEMLCTVEGAQVAVGGLATDSSV